MNTYRKDLGMLPRGRRIMGWNTRYTQEDTEIRDRESQGGKQYKQTQVKEELFRVDVRKNRQGNSENSEVL